MDAPTAGPRPGRGAALPPPWETVCLGLILLAALAVRLLGVARGLPYLHDWDEPLVMGFVVTVLQQVNLAAVNFAYTTAYFYLLLPVVYAHYLYLHLQGLVASPQAIQLYNPLYPFRGAWFLSYLWYTNYPSFYLWGRILTVCFGTATVFLVYRIGTLAFGTGAGLLAAALLAAAPGAVYFADTVRVDVPMTFFATAAVLAGLGVIRRGARWDYVAAGLLAGLAVSTKQSAFPVVLAAAGAHLLNPRRTGLLDLNARLMIYGAAAGMLIGTPSLVVKPWPMIANLWETGRSYGGLPSLAAIQRWGPQYLAYLVRPDRREWYTIPHAGFGLLPAGAAAVGVIAGFARTPAVQAYLVSFPLLYFVFVSGQHTIFVRNMVPVLPFAAVFAAAGAMWLGALVRRAAPAAAAERWRLAGAAAGIACLLAGPVLESARLGWTMGHERDTRTDAIEWLRVHAPPGSRVAVERDLAWYLPALSGLPCTVLFAGRKAELARYEQARVRFAVVGRDSALRSTLPVAAAFLRPPDFKTSPGTALAPGTFLIADPDVFIVEIPGNSGAP